MLRPRQRRRSRRGLVQLSVQLTERQLDYLERDAAPAHKSVSAVLREILTERYLLFADSEPSGTTPLESPAAGPASSRQEVSPRSPLAARPVRPTRSPLPARPARS